ncbi:hypothetical protein Bca101_033345 [Brassica carinata]
MGVAGSNRESAKQQFPEGERYFGFENFGNTCYCNSVLQLLEYYTNNKSEENLLTCLADLFSQVIMIPNAFISPKRFVQRLKKQNVLFRSYMHQDAHEFLNYLLNELDDILEKEAKTDNETSSSPGKISNGPKLLQANSVHKEPTVTWVHKIFQFKSLSKFSILLSVLFMDIFNHLPIHHNGTLIFDEFLKGSCKLQLKIHTNLWLYCYV